MMRVQQRKNVCVTESYGTVDESKPPSPKKAGAEPHIIEHKKKAGTEPHVIAHKRLPASADMRAPQILATDKKVESNKCKFILHPRAPLGTSGAIGTLRSIRYLPDWISLQEEKALMQSIYAEKNNWKQLSNRRLQVHFAACVFDI